MSGTHATTTGSTSSDKALRSAETEAAIVEAALSILAEGGLSALSMRTVAERVELSATAIYHYFDGKEDLVDRVVRTGYQRFGESVAEAAEQHPVGSLERIFALGDAYVRFAFENQEHFRVLYNLQTRPRNIEELPGSGGYELLRRTVVDAMEAGNLRQGNPDVIAHYMWTSVHGLVTLALACNIECRDCAVIKDLPHSAIQLYQDFIPFLTDGLRPGNGVAAERDAEPMHKPESKAS
jgi:AcrR family transcriptional regulator